MIFSATDASIVALATSYKLDSKKLYARVQSTLSSSDAVDLKTILGDIESDAMYCQNFHRIPKENVSHSVLNALQMLGFGMYVRETEYIIETPGVDLERKTPPVAR